MLHLIAISVRLDSKRPDRTMLCGWILLTEPRPRAAQLLHTSRAFARSPDSESRESTSNIHPWSVPQDGSGLFLGRQKTPPELLSSSALAAALLLPWPMLMITPLSILCVIGCSDSWQRLGHTCM
eukprot:scaffold60464_cov38-Prasinocladus_malaysianus.AAC.1